MIPALGLFTLVSCATLDPPAEAAPMLAAQETAAPATFDGLSLNALTRIDPRGTARSARIVLDTLGELTPAERREAAEAVRVLQVTCPFNRASVQLPLAMHAVISKTDPAELDPLIRSDWEYLQTGLESHVAVLDLLGADLPIPTEDDYLYGRLFPDAPLTRAQLAASDDPIAATLPLLASIRFVVDSYPPEATERIDRNTAVLSGPTADQWPLNNQILAWRDGLERMQPFLKDAGRKREVSRILAALDEYAGLHC